MDFFDAVRVLIRRWMVVVPILALVAAVGIFVVTKTPAKFKATANVVFVPPVTSAATSASTSKEPSNPLGPYDLANIVHAIMTSTQATETLVHQGVSPNFTVDVPTNSSNAPLIVIGVTAPSADAATNSAQLLVKFAQAQALEQQKIVGAGTANLDRLVVVTPPTTATRLVGGKVRILLAVAALGVILATSAAFFVESLARRREPVPGATSTNPRQMDDSETSQVEALRGVSTIGHPENVGGKRFAQW